MSFLEPVPAPKKQFDFRAWLPAWIIAGAIVLLIAVAYVIWVNRPRAGYNTRSLSASHSNPAKSAPVTKSLHINGCHEDFIVNPGELVEPRLAPGGTAEQFRVAYGTPLAGGSAGDLHWDEDEFDLITHGSPTGSDATQISQLDLSVKGHHIVQTLDGVELGLDSFGRILSKMQDKKVEIHERIVKDDKNWTFVLSLYSACGKNFRSEYIRTLPRDPETDRQITSLPPSAGLDPSLLRSDVFLNKVAYDYSMMLSNGSNQSTEGQPAGHD